MKTFNLFIQEDFNSAGASQFLISMSADSKKAKNSSPQSVMMFYEHNTGPSLNLTRYAKSFLGSNVMDLMKAPSNDYRILFYVSPTSIDAFIWKAQYHHSQMSRSLDANKDMKKYPSNIKYNYLYNECQMYMKGDTIGPTWCFPLVIFEGDIVLNVSLESLGIIHQQKDIKNVFKIPDLQWSQLINKSQYKL